MKPSDRSLDIAVIGLGQGGGNLAAEFARRGYRAMALNTARSDLSSLGVVSQHALSEAQRLYIGIDGYDGAGSDLNYGRQCVAESAERIREAVARHTEGADVVLLTAGLGGGTGSAVSELVRTLETLQLPVTTLTTLPSDQESGIAKVNAVRAVSELVKLPEIGMIFADNARLAELHGDLALDEYFARVNEIIIDPLDSFNRLNEREGLHPIRTLDGEDLRTLLMSTGVLNYCTGELSGLSVDGVTQWVRDALQNSAIMPASFAMADIAYLGLVIEASAGLLARTPFTFFNEVSERLKAGTTGAGIYMGVYRNDKLRGDNTAVIRLIASTPTLPEGIQRIVSDAQREGGMLRDKLRRSVSSLELGDIAEFDLLPARSASLSTAPAANTRSRRPGRPAPSATASRRPQAGQSSRVQAVSPSISPAVSAASHGAPSISTPSVSAPSLSTQSQAPVAHSSPSLAAASYVPATPSYVPAAPPPQVAAFEAHDSIPDNAIPDHASERAEPETYDRLVDAFLNTDSESIRRRIATRLHSSRNSDHPLARFYANRAIERLVDAGEREALESVMSQLSV
jgi:cell division GTPase FtsZ